MTIGELIEELKKYPHTYPVKVNDVEGWAAPLRTVAKEKNTIYLSTNYEDDWKHRPKSGVK